MKSRLKSRSFCKEKEKMRQEFHALTGLIGEIDINERTTPIPVKSQLGKLDESVVRRFGN